MSSRSEGKSYEPSEALLLALDSLKTSVADGIYPESVQEEILEGVEGYLRGRPSELDPQLIRYLVQGWWVDEAFSLLESGAADPTFCPLCLREKIELQPR